MRLALGGHLDRIRPIALEGVILHIGGGGVGDVQATEVVRREGIALHQGVGLVGQVQSVAAAVGDRVVEDARRGAVGDHVLVVGRTTVAHHAVVQDAAAVIGRIGKVDALPVAWPGPGHRAIAIRIATEGIIAEGGEDNRVGTCTIRHQCTIDGQGTGGVLELDDRARLQGERRSAVDDQPALDDVR